MQRPFFRLIKDDGKLLGEGDGFGAVSRWTSTGIARCFSIARAHAQKDERKDIVHLKNLKIAAAAIGLGLLGSASASAAPVPAASGFAQPGMVVSTSALGSVGSAGQNLATSAVEDVRYRGRHYHRRGGGWVGPAIIAGTAALIIGGSIAQSRAGYRDRWEMCADRFASFSWDDGTYQPFDGPRRVCPYLVR